MNDETIARMLDGRADDVPVSDPPLAALHRDAGVTHRRRGRYAVVLAAAAVLAVIVGGLAVAGLGSQRDRVQPDVVDAPPAGMRWVGIGHAAIAVPEEWPVGPVDGRCILRMNAVIIDSPPRPPDHGPPCQPPADAETITVEPIGVGMELMPIDATEIDGAPALVLTKAPCPEPQCTGFVQLPDDNASFVVSAPDRDAMLARIDQIHVLAHSVAVPGWRTPARSARQYLAELDRLGLEADVTYVDQGLPGRVLDVSSAPGTVLADGSTVRVTVSGPPPEQQADADAPPDGYRWVGRGRVAVAIPVAWPIDASDNCGPTQSTVLVDPAPDSFKGICPRPASAVDVIDIGPLDRHGAVVPDDETRIDGEPAVVMTPSRCFEQPRRCPAFVDLPGQGVSISVSAGSLREVQEIVGRVHVLEHSVAVPGWRRPARTGAAYLAELDRLGLDADVAVVDDGQPGRVLGVSPAAGTVLPDGSTVRVTVSGRPDQQGGDLQPPTGQRWYGLGPVVIPVPADWPTDATQCGTPTEDTVLSHQPGATDACLRPQRDGVETIRVEAAPDGLDTSGWQPETVDGHDALRTGVRYSGRPDPPFAALYVPDLDTLVTVRSSTSLEAAEQVVDGVRVIDGLAGVPDYAEAFGARTDQAVADFRAAAQRAGLEVEVVTQRGPSRFVGVDPAPGTVLPVGSTVTLTVVAPYAPPDEAPPTGYRWVGRGHSAIPVPEDWAINDGSCSAGHVWVDRTVRHGIACPDQPTEVEVRRPRPEDRVASWDPFEVDGHPARRRDFGCISVDSDDPAKSTEHCDASVYLPEDDVVFDITTPAGSRQVPQLLESIRVLDTLVAVPFLHDTSDGSVAVQDYARQAGALGLDPVLDPDDGTGPHVIATDPTPGSPVPPGTTVTLTPGP